MEPHDSGYEVRHGSCVRVFILDDMNMVCGTLVVLAFRRFHLYEWSLFLSSSRLIASFISSFNVGIFRRFDMVVFRTYHGRPVIIFMVMF